MSAPVVHPSACERITARFACGAFEKIAAVRPASLKVEIVKRADGAGVLRCTRPDGSVTWQKQTERHAAFFSLHDLTHFAVESTLGLRGGFFGLIAHGWDIEDTTGKGARGPLPPEAGVAEQVVGLIYMEQAQGASWTPDEFNAYSARPLTQAEIEAIRQRRTELFSQWAAVPVGGTLELKFPI